MLGIMKAPPGAIEKAKHKYSRGLLRYCSVRIGNRVYARPHKLNNLRREVVS
jgi:hypothetical protein